MTGPLDGTRILSLALNLPGPLAAARLLSLGASVTKIEPSTGDPLQAVAPSWYAELVRGQRVLTPAVKTPEGQAILEAEVADADLVLTSMRPSALARLGLAALIERHGTAHVEIVGHDGADAELAGHDLTYQAGAGLLAGAAMPVVPWVDVLGGERAVSAALLALRAREQGRPAVIRVVLEHAATDAGAAARHGLTVGSGALGGALALYGLYACAGGGRVAVAALEPHFVSRLAELAGTSREELTATFATRSATDWERLGRDLDIPIIAVREPASLPADSPDSEPTS